MILVWFGFLILWYFGWKTEKFHHFWIQDTRPCIQKFRKTEWIFVFNFFLTFVAMRGNFMIQTTLNAPPAKPHNSLFNLSTSAGERERDRKRLNCKHSFILISGAFPIQFVFPFFFEFFQLFICMVLLS